MRSTNLTFAGLIAQDIAQRCGRDAEWSTLEAVPVLRVIAEALDGSDAYGPLLDCISEIEAQARANVAAMDEQWLR